MVKQLRKTTGLVAIGVFFVAGILGISGTASAVDDSGPTTTGLVCMQRVYGGPIVTNSNRLNCTANDVSIAEAISAINTATGESSCVKGETFEMQATFKVVVTATGRYDEAFFFNISGQPGATARDVDGTCSESILGLDSPAADLDGDSCGDLTKGTYETITFTIPDVKCEDTDNNKKLNLPNCTSWHSNAQTVCTGFADAAPETKSKCNCNDLFEVPITVESPSGAVNKTATKAVVTYEVYVKNNSSNLTVKINSLVDDKYDDIADPTNTKLVSTNCDALIGEEIDPLGQSSTCQFSVEIANPGTGGDHTNKVTAEIEDTTDSTNKQNVDGQTTINVDLNVTTP